MYQLCLAVAGVSLKLELSSREWFDFCREKFNNFINSGGQPPKANINFYFLSSTSRRSIRIRYVSPEAMTVYFPDSRYHFPLFNYLTRSVFAGVLLTHDGMVIHASSVISKFLSGKPVLFIGPSEAGKSTAAKRFGGRILADDRSIVRKENGVYYVYGSPFYDSHPTDKTPGRFRLERLFFLKKRRRADSFLVKPLAPAEAAFRLIPRIQLRTEAPRQLVRRQIKSAILLATDAAAKIKSYQLSFPLAEEKNEKDLAKYFA